MKLKHWEASLCLFKACLTKFYMYYRPQMHESVTSEEVKMTSGAVTLFCSAARLSMASASAILPWESSHLGDSGINLVHEKQNKNTNTSFLISLVSGDLVHVPQSQGGFRLANPGV